MTSDVEVHEGIPDGELLDAWGRLVDQDPDATIFHMPRYLAVWHRQLGQHVTPRVRVVTDDDGRLVGVVPEARELEGSPTGPREVIRFLGGSEVTDYLGPVSAPADREAVAVAYLTSLAEDRDWDEFVADGVAEDAGWAQAFEAHAHDVGLNLIEEGLEDVCPRIDLGAGYDAYLNGLGSKQRHEQRRKARKLARDAGDVQLIEVPESGLEKSLESFFDMVRASDDDKSRFFLNDEMRSFFHALAEEFGPERRFRIHQLNVAGAPAAATLSFVEHGTWSLYNSAFDQHLWRLAPGMVLVSELIRVAAEDEQCGVFDLLRGAEPYKYRFGAVDRPLRRFSLVRGE